MENYTGLGGLTSSDAPSRTYWPTTDVRDRGQDRRTDRALGILASFREGPLRALHDELVSRYPVVRRLY